MKQVIFAIATIAMVSCAQTVVAQEKKEEEKKKKHSISLGMDGLSIKTRETDSNKHVTVHDERDDEDNESKKPKRFSMNTTVFDLGINLLQDNTNYADPNVQAFLNVPAGKQNENLFSLKPGKSINVNIYPLMVRYAAVRTKGQRIYISTGLGLQLYNFRYDEPITYTQNPAGIVMDTISFKKNKLGMDYLSVPLMLTFKTRLHKKNWLVYGVGVTGGYRICSWTKQVSGQRGKVKGYDAFGTADFNTCVSAEIGLDGVFRVFGTYQLTSMYDNGLDQHPICFGIRFSGI